MYLPHLAGKRILLGSASPRRLELLKLIGLDPVVVVRDVDESFPADLPATHVAEYVARLKAHAFEGALHPDDVLITGDTVVECDGLVLGKPSSDEEAVDMLHRLSGRTHRVHSGFTVSTAAGGLVSGTDSCQVTFSELSEGLISSYVASGAARDKAGAYGIQDPIGAIGIAAIHGSYFTVMGLPVHLMYITLQCLK